MHTDAKPHLAILGHGCRHCDKAFLNRKRGGNRAGCGFEHRKHRIACHIDYATVVGLDMFSKDTARGIERSQGRQLVPGHQA
jgi:hypothetical protein